MTLSQTATWSIVEVEQEIIMTDQIKFIVVSKGDRKAEVIIQNEDGSRETRHLLLTHNGWTDRLGNGYNI
jgi:hypothetical protein